MAEQRQRTAFPVRALVAKWAGDNHIKTVNRSYGEQTTDTVSVAALERLVRSAIETGREACAKVEDARAMRCEEKVALAQDADEVTHPRSLERDNWTADRQAELMMTGLGEAARAGLGRTHAPTKTRGRATEC